MTHLRINLKTMSVNLGPGAYPRWSVCVFITNVTAIYSLAQAEHPYTQAVHPYCSA